MYSHFSATSFFLLPALLRSFAYASPEVHDGDSGLYNFVSRPDIRAPKWDITIYDESALSPGYWFFGPYETLNMDDEMGNGWIGPHIYDQDGTLIWSGAPMFDNGNVEDFRLSDVDMGDGVERLMTVMDQRHAKGVFINNHYKEIRRVKANGNGIFNSHEFNFVENGTKALVVYTDIEDASREESESVGQENCRRACNGINEYDVATWDTTFRWSSCPEGEGEGGITLDESTLTGGSIEKKCHQNWDYVHANSIDKTSNGDYIFSCRHSDAIYKISHVDGSIIWRLGGTKSDFKHIDDFAFMRQHNVRYRGSNETHTLISILDNAKGIDNAHEPSYKFSRGILIALDERSTPMTAQIVKQLDHPDGEGTWAFRRGNYQDLPNGNIFMCWSERALQSEHSSDGKMLMQARLQPEWLGTYRSYKFDGFVGMPDDPPDVVAKAAEADDRAVKGGMKTTVWVSWNGATEVVQWKLYSTTESGGSPEHISTVEKTGFETDTSYIEHTKYIIVEALASNGTVLGTSKVTKVLLPNDPEPEPDDKHNDKGHEDQSMWYSIRHNPIFIIVASATIGCVTFAAIVWAIVQFRRRGGRGMGFMDLLTRGRYRPLKDRHEGANGYGKPLLERSFRDSGEWDGDIDLDHEQFALGGEDEEDEEREGRRGRYDPPKQRLEREEGRER